jgi:Ricin-type beta-trefoil lectin domain
MRRLRWLLLISAAAALGGLGISGMVTAVASAQRVPPPGSTGLANNVDILSNMATYYCLSDHPAGVTHDPCPADPTTANPRLLWQVEVVHGGVMLRNLGTHNECLVGSSIRVGQGDRVGMLPCGGDGHKLWSARTGDGGEVFQNLAYRQPMCLDDTGKQKVTMQPCVSNDDHQGWFAP